ncbi:hypothetical protein EO087_01345 [Dyella sp. M7H15-1]|uniref:hypothetical protein n=1 Tax=Dyella sp. M7H15-1 TaxID=2501295 RepID=UPI001004ECBB|nr:hypothetical protein [Dyella sp. M7H15-1]QAU22792.1 hypothetical protein EO087_01345 [Dyella sp. M7H15-1]
MSRQPTDLADEPVVWTENDGHDALDHAVAQYLPGAIDTFMSLSGNRFNTDSFGQYRLINLPQAL